MGDMLKGAIFDFDGTLVDSMAVWDTIGADYLRSLGIRPKEPPDRAFQTFSLAEAAEYYRANYGIAHSVGEIIGGVNERIKESYRTKVALKKGVAGYLAYLHSRGVTMCIATLSDKELVKDTVLCLGISDFFSEIFACSETNKTEPDIYRRALSYLGTKKAETYVFEDAFYAAETAKKDGFPVVGINDAFEPNQEELKRIADVYVQDFSDPILRKLLR